MAKKQQQQETAKPAFEAKLGSIRVTVWKNCNDSGAVWHNVTIERRFKQGDEWASSNSLTGAGDIALAIEALELAKAFVISQEFDL